MELKSDVVSTNRSNEISHIPVFDLSYLNSSAVDWSQMEKSRIDQLARNFGKALRDSGLIFIENHGISIELINKAFDESLKFFQLDSTVKEKYAKLDYTNASQDGYATLGIDSLTNTSEPREFFNFHKNFQIKDNTQSNDALKNSDDELVFEFKTTFITLEQQCAQLFIKLLRLLSLSLEMEEIDFFVNTAKSLVDKSVDSYNIIRTLYYPPLSSLIGQEDDSIAVGNGMRFSEHSDWGVFTLLFRDVVDGLEVRTNDGNWVTAEPDRGAIVLFVGDLLELWTGRHYRAAVHRVRQLTEEDEKNQSRQSIAYFLNLDSDVLVEPLTEGICCKNDEIVSSIQFEPFTIHSYVENKGSAAYGRK